MIQLVQPRNAGKQVRVKRSGKQMEARSRWKERREAAEGSGGGGEEGRAGGWKKRETQRTKGCITQCPKIIKATWEQYKAIK